MNSKDIVKLVTILGIALVAIFAVTGYFGNKKAAIEADRAEQVRQIEAEEAKVIAAQKTERTEERSHFWQQLIPYGEAEAESNDTQIDQPKTQTHVPKTGLPYHSYNMPPEGHSGP